MPKDSAAPSLHRAVPFILAGCTAVSVLSTDVITPSVPDYPDVLGGDVRLAQMTVSVNLLAYALAQLIHGPVADAIGRKRILLMAFGLFTAASLLCAFAGTIHWLLGGRFLQGLFSSVPSVVIVLLIRELYGGERALGVMALYGMALGIAPAMGPLLGGYLHVWFGWQAGYVFVALLAITMSALVWKFVPESLETPHKLHLGQALGSYARLLATPDFLRTGLAVSLAFAAYFAYVTTAPVVMIDLLGLKTQHYGLTNLVIIGCFILGNLAASQVKDKIPIDRLLRIAMAVMLVAMVALVMQFLVLGPMIWTVLMCMGVYAMGLAFVLAAGPIIVLNHVADQPQGSASAMLGSMQLGVSSLGGYVSAKLYNGTALPMSGVMLALVARVHAESLPARGGVRT